MNTSMNKLILIIAFFVSVSGVSSAENSMKQVLQKPGIAKGICVVFQSDNPDLAAAIAANTELFIYFMAKDNTTVAEMRKIAESKGLLGSRLIAEKGRPDSIPFADRFVDLLVSPNETISNMQLIEFDRVLRPRAKVLLKTSGSFTAKKARELLSAAKFVDIEEITSGKDIWCIAKKAPNPAEDDWRHWYHEPDNNPVSTDTKIKGPFMLQWVDKPYQLANEVVTTAAAGRIFTATGDAARFPIVEATKNMVIARNGYNGTILWQRKLPAGYKVHRSANIATEETFYLIEKNEILLINPETGEVKKKIDIAGAGNEIVSIALEKDMLFALIGQPDTAKAPLRRPMVPYDYTKKDLKLTWLFGNTIVAYDVKKNAKIWEHKEKNDIDSRTIGIMSSRIYFYVQNEKIACLDSSTGETYWEQKGSDILKDISVSRINIFRTSASVLCVSDTVIFDFSDCKYIIAFASKNGDFLWKIAKTNRKGMARLIHFNNKLYASCIDRSNAYSEIDIKTGVSKRIGFQDHTCARANACPVAIFTRAGGGMPDANGRLTKTISVPMRSSCFDGILPANGLLYLTPMSCSCYNKISGFITIAPKGNVDINRLATDKDNLEYGNAAKTTAAKIVIDEKDWPAYRSRISRGNSTPVSISNKAKELWMYKESKEYIPSAATAVDNFIYIGGSDGKLRCLDAKAGKLQWQFSTAGRVRIPPHIDSGNAYIGSCDGFIYCIDAVSGTMKWRFRASAVDRRIMIFGMLGSTWPINSGILVANGIAYAGAGVLGENGTYIYALDAETGKIKWQNNNSGMVNGRNFGVSMLGGLTLLGNQLVVGSGADRLSPAFFSIAEGTLLNSTDFKSTSNGEIGYGVGIIENRYIVSGGQMLYSDEERVMDGNTYLRDNVSFKEIAKESPGHSNPSLVMSATSNLLPVWDSESIAFLGAGASKLGCWDTKAFIALLDEKGKTSAKAHSSRWSLPRGYYPENPKWGPANYTVLSMAMARNAVVIAGSNRRNWLIAALDKKTGSELWQKTLPAQPAVDGIAINRNGQIIVSLIDGRIACFGE